MSIRLDQHLVTEPWKDYELLDSGENMKLERFGEVVVARPETQALWAKRRPELWSGAHAVFAFRDKRGGWDKLKELPDPWELGFIDARFTAALTSFKHTGIFPEQSPNWIWSAERIAAFKEARNQTAFSDRVHAQGAESGLVAGDAQAQGDRNNNATVAPSVLNLFGYTGIATSVAALAGAKVTHVDASKQSLDWARNNARRSGLPNDAVRWLLDDALAFAKREVRRGNRYEGIILDPPAFGRGAKGEVWKIEEQLPELLTTLRELLSDTPGSFFLLNGYASGYAPRSFAQALESVFGEVDGESGELHIKESSSDRVIPAGIYVRFVR